MKINQRTDLFTGIIGEYAFITKKPAQLATEGSIVEAGGSMFGDHGKIKARFDAVLVVSGKLANQALDAIAGYRVAGLAACGNPQSYRVSIVAIKTDDEVWSMLLSSQAPRQLKLMMLQKAA